MNHIFNTGFQYFFHHTFSTRVFRTQLQFYKLPKKKLTENEKLVGNSFLILSYYQIGVYDGSAP